MGNRTVFDYECDFGIIEWWRLAVRMEIDVCRGNVEGDELGMGCRRGEGE